MLENSILGRAVRDKVLSFFDVYKNVWLANGNNIESIIYKQTCGTESKEPQKFRHGKKVHITKSRYSHRLPEQD